MAWYFKDSNGTRGPLTEPQLRTLLATGFDPLATVRSDESSWVSATIAKAKFSQLENEGVYLRSNDKVHGPYLIKRADELRVKSPDYFDSYKFGREGKWQSIESWTTADLEKPMVPETFSEAINVNAQPVLPMLARKTKRNARSQVPIASLVAVSVLLFVVVLLNRPLFDRSKSEDRSHAGGDFGQAAHAKYEEQKQHNAEITKATLGPVNPEIERLRANLQQLRLRSNQTELQGGVREELELMSVRLEGELHILEEQEAARIANELRRSEAKQRQEQLQIAASAAQAERKRLCEKLFAKVDVSPALSVRVADILTEFKASIELRGADYERITQSLKDQDWIGLINVLLKKNYTELPDAQSINSAVEALANYDFQILLRIVDPEILQYFEKPDSDIKLMTTWVETSQDNLTLTLCSRQSWTDHPDGIGFLQDWKPSQGRSVIALVKQHQWSTKQKELTDTYAARINYLQQKSRLGEIPSDLLPQFYENQRLEFSEAATAWALGVSPLNEGDASKSQSQAPPNGPDAEVLAIQREKLLAQFVGRELAAATTIPAINLAMRWIAPGKFEMGSSTSEVGRSKNENRVKVTLTKGFWISETEVTQGLWKSIMNSEPWQPKVKQTGPQFPATCVSWSDCQEFTRRLSTQARREKLIPSDWEFSLPTEAQWELACRGGSETAFSFGNDTAELVQYAWFRGKESGESEIPFARRVATKQPNQYGLFDMHGNVMEWCLDSYTEQPSGGTDPLRFMPNSPRIYRGGSWTKPAAYCRSAYRGAVSEDFWETDLGFRLVLREVVASNSSIPSVASVNQSTATARKNYVLNGKFEQNQASVATPSHWYTWPTTSERCDYTAKVGSGYCLNHFFPQKYFVVTGQSVSGLPVGTYQLSFTVACSGGQSQAHASVKNYGGPERRTPTFGAIPSPKRMSIDNVKITSGRCSITFTSDAKGGQWINIYDVKLEQTGD